MILRRKTYLLEFKHPFGVSSNIRTHTPTVLIELNSEGICGYGEASVPPYLGETVEQVNYFLDLAEKHLKKHFPETPLSTLINSIDTLATGYNAAKAALDIALHDWHAKRLRITTATLLNIPLKFPVATAATIAIGDPLLLEQKIEEAYLFPVLKVKLGTDNDKKIIQQIRKFTDKPLYVDVNQGWKNINVAVEMLKFLKDQHVLLVEQPMPVDCLYETTQLKEKNILPLIADESVKRWNDINSIYQAFDGINIKLMKSTGLQEAKKMIDLAEKREMKIYLGCMGESSCATSAMVQLSALADYIDLDAPFLMCNDPFTGFELSSGGITLHGAHGNGIGLSASLFSSN